MIGTTVSHKQYVEISGRHAKLLQRAQDRDGIPCAGAEVDLTEVLHAFHDLLAKKERENQSRGDP